MKWGQGVRERSEHYYESGVSTVEQLNQMGRAKGNSQSDLFKDLSEWWEMCLCDEQVAHIGLYTFVYTKRREGMVKRRGCIDYKMYYIINDIKGTMFGNYCYV